jgi:hypothetical protein
MLLSVCKVKPLPFIGATAVNLYARKQRALGSFPVIRFATTLPLPQLLQSSRLTKLAIGASGCKPKHNGRRKKRVMWWLGGIVFSATILLALIAFSHSLGKRL